MDGGHDHRVTYISVQLALIWSFRRLPLDYLVAAKTAPMQSFRNPVERVMAILNLGLQSVGLMRASMEDELERLFSKCLNLSEIRSTAEKYPRLKEGFQQSVRPALDFLQDIFGQLKLHDETVTTMPAATEDAFEELWQEINAVDPTVQQSDMRQENIKSNVKLNEFMEHCCRSQ